MADYLPLITGGGGAMVVLALWVYAFFLGKIHSDSEFTKLEDENRSLRAENDGLRTALSTERRTVDDTASAGQVTNQLISALAGLAAGRRPLAKPDLTPEDVGL